MLPVAMWKTTDRNEMSLSRPQRRSTGANPGREGSVGGFPEREGRDPFASAARRTGRRPPRASSPCFASIRPNHVKDRLETLITIADTLDDQLGDARVTVRAIASDLEVDPGDEEAAEMADLSHRRLQAVADRLGELADEMRRDLEVV